jgi:hypothetical protein
MLVLVGTFTIKKKMLQREDIAHLISKHSLMQGEVDPRHLELINEIYVLGIDAGRARAKAAIQWRISGPLWAQFIEEDLCP